jgi:leucyl/phenylalanyl-tRNA--protein transferase
MIPWLNPDCPGFPDPEKALSDPDGLLAAGGALDPRFMVLAYANGIFPWFSEGEPILWWSPSRRAVIEPDGVLISKSFSKSLRNKPWSVKLDQDFDRMVHLCATLPRQGPSGTWIVQEMRDAYAQMHANGLAHSVEVFYDGEFCGGLFGVKLGGMFYGESMASMRPDASKVALAHVCLAAPDLGIGLIDCQMMTEHLASMGARETSRGELRSRIASLVKGATPESWVGVMDGFDMSKRLAELKLRQESWGAFSGAPRLGQELQSARPNDADGKGVDETALPKKFEPRAKRM